MARLIASISLRIAQAGVELARVLHYPDRAKHILGDEMFIAFGRLAYKADETIEPSAEANDEAQAVPLRDLDLRAA